MAQHVIHSAHTICPSLLAWPVLSGCRHRALASYAACCSPFPLFKPCLSRRSHRPDYQTPNLCRNSCLSLAPICPSGCPSLHTCCDWAGTILQKGMVQGLNLNTFKEVSRYAALLCGLVLRAWHVVQLLLVLSTYKTSPQWLQHPSNSAQSLCGATFGAAKGQGYLWWPSAGNLSDSYCVASCPQAGP